MRLCARLFVLFTLPALWPGCLWAAPDAKLNLPDFDDLADKATEVVNITLDQALLTTVAGFLAPSDPKDADLKQLLQGLRGIYVKSYTFPESVPLPMADLDSVRKQVMRPGWNQIVDVRSTKEHANVGIYLSLDGRSHTNGMALIAIEPRKFTIVNIVGSIDLEQLKRLQGKFGIPQLPVDGKPPGKSPGGPPAKH